MTFGMRLLSVVDGSDHRQIVGLPDDLPAAPLRLFCGLMTLANLERDGGL
jgi:hypothetical protein